MSDESSAFSLLDSRLPEPIAFRRIDSIACREEDSILVDEDSKEHHVVSMSLPNTPQILTQSQVNREMDNCSQPNSIKTQIIPEETVTSYAVSTLQFRQSEPTIKQIRSSTDSLNSVESVQRRLTQQIQSEPVDYKKRNTMFVMRQTSKPEEIPEENELITSFQDNYRYKAGSYSMLASQKESQYVRTASPQLAGISQINQWADELATQMRVFLNNIQQSLNDYGQRSFSFDHSGDVNSSPQDESLEITQQILKRAYELIIPLTNGSVLSPIPKQTPPNPFLSPKFEPLGVTSFVDSAALREKDDLKQQIETLQNNLDIAEFRMMEFYQNEQDMKKVKQNLEKQLQDKTNQIKQLEIDLQNSVSQSQLQELQTTNSFLEKVISDKTSLIQNLNTQLEQMKSQLQNSQKEFLLQVQERDEQIQKIQTQYLDLSLSSQNDKQLISELEQRLQSMEEKKTKVSQVLQQKLDQEDFRKDNTDQLKDYEEKVIDIEKQLSFYKSKLDQLIELKDKKTYQSFLSNRLRSKENTEKSEQSFNLKAVQTVVNHHSKENSNEDLRDTIPKPVRWTKVNKNGHIGCQSLNTSVTRTSQSPNSMNVTPARKKAQFTTPTPTPKQSTVCTEYKGERSQGMRHGRGKQYYPDGSLYQGGWQFDKRNGFGTLKMGDKEIYSGHWNNDLKHGCGHLNNLIPQSHHLSVDYMELNNAPWVSYQGEFKEDQFNGFGVLTFSSGERFHGFFKGGKPNGKGNFYRVDNEIIPGRWLNGIYK